MGAGANCMMFALDAAVESSGGCEYDELIGRYDGEGWMGRSGGCCEVIGGIAGAVFGADVAGVCGVMGVWGLLLWVYMEGNWVPLPWMGGSVGRWLWAPL